MVPQASGQAPGQAPGWPDASLWRVSRAGAHTVSDLAITKPRPAKGSKGGKRQGGGLLAALLQDEPAVGRPPPAAALQGLEFCKRFEPIGDFTGGTFTGHVVAMHSDGRVSR